ncbi:hypothetical protein LUZ60_006307 [Juncus effusus]|nr:hypothetical protein LUZ60_006307 [Juncus effusus]
MKLPLSFFFYLLMLRPQSLLIATAETNKNQLTPGSTLNPSGSNSYITSPSGDFAFGFQTLPSNSSYILAIWFNKTSPQTVVWFATNSANSTDNMRNPVLATKSFTLRLSGSLSLMDPNGKEAWNPSPTNATKLSLLDSGNLILYDSNNNTLWQSFDVPTDTLLPKQSLAQGSMLLSKLTDSDFSAGRFELYAQNDGNLALYPIALPTSDVYDASIWDSSTDTGTTLIFNTSGSLNYQLMNGTENIVLSGVLSRSILYQRATLDPDGVFRLYFYSGNPGKWSVMDKKPIEGCSITSSDKASVICGVNAYCNSNNSQEQLNCECPPQYSFLDPQYKFKGCKPDFTLQSCFPGQTEFDPSQADGFDFVEVANTDWPLGDYAHYSGVQDVKTCKALCLPDCFCAVFVVSSSGCWKKKLPLTNGQKDANVYGKQTFIKIGTNNSTSQQRTASSIIDKKNYLFIIGVISLGVAGLVLSIAIILAVKSKCCIHRSSYHKNDPELEPMIELNLKKFAYEEVQLATADFREELGSGAFGTVYKGELSTGTYIAVKRLHRLSNHAKREFINEMQSIGRTYHKNLVKLLGFCNEGTYRMLIYEYMSHGSLTNYLFGETRPPWSQRVKIAISIARGIRYLHEECDTQIIHCDIKPPNILLDHNIIPKISDFGLAKLLYADHTQTTTFIRGTKGYVAPEWFRNTPITAKVDVYSFGVMLLEIICCKRNLERNTTEEIDEVLIYLVSDCVRDGRINQLVKGDDEALADMATVERFVRVAILCVQEEPSQRPSMHDVSSMLEGIVPVYAPPNFFLSSHSTV